MYVCLIAISKSRTTKGCCVCIFIVMTADDLVTGGPRASANIMFSKKEKKCTVAFLFHFPTLNQWMFFWNCSLNLLKDKDKMQSLQLQCCDCWCTGDGYNWGICRHNILSGLLSLLKLKWTLTLLSQKRQYNAKFAFCHVMTADDLLKCGPMGISGHNCIYLKIYISISVLKSHLDMLRLSLKEKNVYADMAQIVLVSIL